LCFYIKAKGEEKTRNMEKGETNDTNNVRLLGTKKKDEKHMNKNKTK
jgi:hypothetical protein